jgi:hypothetical protein
LSTKAELLLRLKKPQLLDVAKRRKITIEPSLSKEEIVSVLSSRLTKAEVECIISKYKVETEREVTERVRIIEHERKIKEKVRAEEEVSIARFRVKKSREEIIQDIISAIERYDYPKEELLREYKRKTGELVEAKTPYDVLFKAPQNFLEYMYRMFYTTSTGRGIEYRFLKWLKENDKYVGYLAREKPESIQIRPHLKGKTGTKHEIDIYVSAKLGVREQIKLGISPLNVNPFGEAIEYFIECKSQRSSVDVNVISDFKGKVEDICEETGIEPSRLIIVASSDFTEDATNYASGIRVHDIQIELIKEGFVGQFVRVVPA